MSKKLGRDEQISSIGALQSFYFNNESDNGPFMAKVKIVDKNSNAVEILSTNIVIAYDSMTQRINIMWEDAGYSREEFNRKGLFGYYDCTWVPMSFDNGVLKIDSIDSDKIIYVS